LAFLIVPFAPVLAAGEEAKAAPKHEDKDNVLGRLDYIDHLTREDLLSVTSIETSPDGRYAYAAAYNVPALTVFKRDGKTGRLEHIQTISDSDNLQGAVSARVSPDGRYVACTAFRSNTVSLFERDKAAGTINMLDIVKQDQRGGQGLSWVIDVVFSPDSRFLYSIADHGQGAALSVFRITAERKLELVETNHGEDKCFLGARGVAISPKGAWIYVSSYQASSLVVLDRDAASGKTKLRQIIKDEQGDVHGLGGVYAVTCSPDGDFVYTSAGRFGGDNAVCVFKKMSDGTLSLVQEIFDGQEGLVGFVGGNELRVSPDGQNLYAVGSRSNSVAAFTRGIETGKLTYLQTFDDGQATGVQGSASGIGISPDGEYVYIAGESDSSILILKRLTGAKKEPKQGR
jgi:6-phosphogluconolactonase (cycloisomerase 2 family)